ncbi:MAG: ATP synthase subunit I [Burkholderiaceae bacterium]|nr:ATP synthase subunit I [Burkholderiaceae bacterium]
MFAAVGLQVATVFLAGLIAAGVSDWTSAKFLALGGAAAMIPNALFALRLAVQKGRPAESYPVVFFLGEFVKIGLTLGLLAWIMHWQTDIRWLALIIGLIVALTAPLFALLVVRDAPRDWPERDEHAAGGRGR